MLEASMEAGSKRERETKAREKEGKNESLQGKRS